jgi:hypothetical protein
MVLIALADMTLDMTIWSVKKVYDIGHWIIWGRQKSQTEILLENQNKIIETLHNDLQSINKRLEHIEKIEDKKDTNEIDTNEKDTN